MIGIATDHQRTPISGVMVQYTVQQITRLTSADLIKTMVARRAARANWNGQDIQVYSAALEGLVTLAKKEVMWPPISITEGVIEAIMQSELGCMDNQDTATYVIELRKLVALAKNEKTLEMKRDLAAALGTTSSGTLLPR